MRKQLEHLFGEAMRGYIELAWTPSDNRKINQAEYFGVDRTEELIERAIEVNTQPGCNVFIGAALRRPESPPFGRAEDCDFYALTSLYADLDTREANENVEKIYRARKCPPTGVTVTGRHPHRRAQLYWLLDEPITDPDESRAINKGLAYAFNGDPSVRNPSRVMRLAGSIAWPKKEGRKLETTEWFPIQGGTFLKEQVINAYGLDIEKLKEEDSEGISDAPRHPISGRIDIVQTLRATQQPGHWHDNMRDAVASMIGAGWTDEQIRTACDPYCDRGAYDPDLDPLIYGARKKYDKPDPDETQQEQPTETSGLRLKDWTAARYPKGQAPEIEWLIEGVVPLATSVVLAGMGGIGKSYLELDLALKIAAGPNTGIAEPQALGGKIAAHGTAVILSAEDSAASVHRRLDKIDPSNLRERAGDKLMVVAMPDAGGTIPLIVDDKKLGLRRGPLFDILVDQLSEIDGLRLIAIDPLTAFTQAQIGDNTTVGRFVADTLTLLSVKTGATVVGAHHVRKANQASITTPDQAREAILGVAQTIDGVRLALALWKADELTGMNICKAMERDYDGNAVVQGAVVKANDETDWTIRTYLRAESGLLEDITAQAEAIKRSSKSLSWDQIETIFAEVDKRWSNQHPFSGAPNSDRSMVRWMGSEFSMDRKAAGFYVDQWMGNGYLGEEIYDSRNKKLGIVVKRVPKPDA